MKFLLENGAPVVVLADGRKLAGLCEDGYYVFKGIPYAKAERFHAPEPSFWEGTLDCTAFGKKAMQVFDKPNPWGGPVADASEFSEDCLNLNIYIPAEAAEAAEAGLPVLFDIHGGSFQDGSNQQKTPQAAIHGNPYIYVAINYRLGILGYAYLKNLLGDAYADSGNLGTMDQLQALRFVKNYIAAFGGDPDRITVLGASAGAKAIGTLMLLPEFDRLASQVILSSGATQAVRSIETADKMTRNFLLSMKKVAGTDDPAALLTMDPYELMQVQKDFIDNPGSTCMFGPVADGITVPVDAESVILAGTSFTGRAMVGSNLHELCFHKMMGVNLEERGPVIAWALFGNNGAIADQDFADYMAAHPDATADEKNDFWTKILSDYMYRTYTERLAARLAAKGDKVWQYEAALAPAMHVFDQLLAFNDLTNFPMIQGEENLRIAKEVGAKIYESFRNFILTGDPQVEGWESLDPADPKKMVWDVESKVMAVAELPTLQNVPEDIYRL